jgi:hypothetical protein
MGWFFGIVLATGIFVSSSFFCFSYSVIEAYFLRILYDIFSAPLVHISGVIIISLLVCSVSVQSHRMWSTVSPVSQKGHCGSVCSVHSWSMGSSCISRFQSGDYHLFPFHHVSCVVIFVFYLSCFHVVASVSPSLFSDLCHFCF